VNTLVIDLDPQGDSTLGLLGEPASTMDIAEVLSSPRTETIDRSIISTPWSKDAPSHLDIIPGSSRSSLMDSPPPAPRESRRPRHPPPWAEDCPSHPGHTPGPGPSSPVGPPTPAPREVRRLRHALDKRTHQYDLVLIDCPPSLNGLTQMAMAASDRSLVVAEP